MNTGFRFGPHVEEARARRQPIVTLETVVTASNRPGRPIGPPLVKSSVLC